MFGACGAGFGIAALAGTAAASSRRAAAAPAPRALHGHAGVVHGQQDTGSGGPSQSYLNAVGPSTGAQVGADASRPVGSADAPGQSAQDSPGHGHGHGDGNGTSPFAPSAAPSTPPGAPQGPQSTPQTPQNQSGPHGTGAHANGAHGNGAQGNSAHGNSAHGNGAHGDQQSAGQPGGRGWGHGNGQTSAQPQVLLGTPGQGGQGQGSQGQGGQSPGSQSPGSQSQGQGSQSPGSQSQGSQSQSPGSQSPGSQSQGSQSQSQGSQSQGSQSQGSQSQGNQGQGNQSQNGQSQGGQSQGGQSQGGQSQGGQSQNGQSQNGQSQNGQSQNGQSQGSQSQSPQGSLPTSQPSSPITTTPVTTVPIVTTPITTTPITTTPTNPSSPLTGSNLASVVPLSTANAAAPALGTTPLGLGLGFGPGPAIGPGATLPAALTTIPLLGAAAPTTAATTAGGTAHTPGQTSRPGHRNSRGQPGSASPVTRVINNIEQIVPGYVWIALAASIALAAIGTGAALVAGRRVRRQAGQFAAVTAAAMTDPLTGVLNRRGFVDALERELARSRRYGLMFTLAYVDVRGLKAVNDSEGHLAGDKLLNEAAHLLKDSARADDVVGRIGGDEMGLLLVEQGAEGASAVIRRVTSQIPERRAALGIQSQWDLTVGTASFPEDGSTVNELLATADRRLYEQRGIALR